MAGCGGSSDEAIENTSELSANTNVLPGNNDVLSVNSDVVSGNSSADALLAELNGEWVTDSCIAEQDQSLSETISFSDNTMIRTLVRHTASTNCSDNFTISRSFVADVEVSGETSVTSACLLYTSPSPRDRTRSRMPSSA